MGNGHVTALKGHTYLNNLIEIIFFALFKLDGVLASVGGKHLLLLYVLRRS